jgi:hypothetical protein
MALPEKPEANLYEEIEAWQLSVGLVDGSGDPGTIGPEDNYRLLSNLNACVEVLRDFILLVKPQTRVGQNREGDLFMEDRKGYWEIRNVPAQLLDRAKEALATLPPEVDV